MKKITTDQAKERILLNNSNIIFLSDFLGTYNKSKFKCLICNHEWTTTAKYVINGDSGCPECGKKKAKETIKYNLTTEDFKKKVYKKYGDNINIIGKYINAITRIESQCNICDHIWKPYAKNLIAGTAGCYKCRCKNTGVKIRKSPEKFLNEINKIHNDRISILGEYKTCNSKMNVKCNVCGNLWTSNTARELLRRGCPKCNLSKGELLISDILKKLKINYNDQHIINGLKTEDNGTPSFDFVLYDEYNNVKTIIEYDGLQHFKAVKRWGGIKRLERQQKIDKFKNNYCGENNIKMIRVPYTDLKKINIEYIKNLLK